MDLSYPTLLDLDGNTLSMDQLWSQKPVLIFWLRHFG